ncbi:ATP-dependent DNA ligase, partial [Endobacter medicaginis]
MGKAYAEKRDFDRTPEPPGGTAAARDGARSLFVVQKHAARRLHWDFRLEHGGTLWSWAVPKGPSMDPADKRLAVHVEDHPVDYAAFEGEIPKGNYGAGTVEIWDRGTWRPLQGADPAAALAKGELKFALDGERLHGGFVLVRMKPRKAKGDRANADNWLLIKEQDDDARQGAGAAVLEDQALAPVRRPAGGS